MTMKPSKAIIPHPYTSTYFITHLLQNSPANRGMITLYVTVELHQVTVELRLRVCYQAIPLEAIFEEDWLMLTLTMITKLRLVK